MNGIKVLLNGGPSYLPAEERVQFAESLETTIKHCFSAGYEHFSHQGRFSTVNGEKLPVFEWFGRTRIAE
jgi:hypothetical protein